MTKHQFHRALIVLFVSSLGLSLSAQNTGSVRGAVQTSDAKAAEYVNVGLKGTTQGSVTNHKGEYEISNIKAGTYTLVLSLTGLETREIPVEVKTGETTLVPLITLKENAKTLQEAVVTGNRAVRRESEYIARLPLKNIENPQVYNIVDKELLKEQVNTGFDDALKNVPGVDKLWTSTGRGSDGAAYFSLRGFSVQPTMINGLAGLTNGGLDPSNIERVEVIKGPSGTLFGSSVISFGGLINIVTKKPYDHLGGEVSFTGGSFGLTRITADVNTPVNKKLNFRINSAYHYEGSFQDAGFKRSFFVAPSFSYKANERLSFHVSTEFYQAESTNPLMVFLNRSRKLIATNPEELGMDFNRSFTSNDVTIKTPTFNIYGQAQYKINSKWTSQTMVASSNRQSMGYYQYVMFILPGDSLLNRYVSDQHFTGVTTNIQQNFIGDFTLGRFRNRVVAGVDYFSTVSVNNSSAYILFDTLNSRGADNDYTLLTKAALDSRFAQNNNPTKNTTKSSTLSAYVSNVIDLNGRLFLMLSLRADRFDNLGTYTWKTNTTAGAFQQTALSPKFGAVYQVYKEKLSVFANYMNGFRNVAAATQPDGTVSNFVPQQANQMEGGIKVNVFKGKLSGSVSYYDILVTNVVRPDPAKAGFSIQDGNIYSRGVEVDITANPLPGLSLIAGYSHNNSINEKTDENTIGRRPLTAGPADLFNSWISYRLTRGKLKGAGLGFGANYAGENKVTNGKVTGEFTIPAYTVYSSTIFYNTDSYRIGLKADNLSNLEYWKGWSTLEAQMPRRVLLNLSFRF